MMNDIAPLLMQRRVFTVARALLLIGGHRIQLKPHMAKQRRQAAKRNAVLAEGGVAVAVADVRAHHFRREEVAHTALDGVALEGIIIVGSPEAMAALQHFIIDTPSAGGAGFKFNMREAGHQRIQQAIELASLRIGGGFTIMGRLHQFTVHIPLHIVHGVLAQQPAHSFQQIIKGFRDIQVQDKLMTSGDRRIARQRQQPVRMCAV